MLDSGKLDIFDLKKIKINRTAEHSVRTKETAYPTADSRGNG